MPYTPPSHRSPSTSAPPSPDVSRRSSFHGTTAISGPAVTRPALPRSASYLTKHRRTPAAPLAPPPPSAISATPDTTPPGTSEDLKGMVTGSIRQSPPPVTDARSMPAGAIISPPESQSSSEDEGAIQEERGRQIENLKELQEAISSIPQHRESSPNSRTSAGDLLVLPSQIKGLVAAVQNGFSVEVAAAASSRRVSHVRSSTEPNLFLSKSADASISVSEDSEEDDPPRKPQMVRKKSGELVRPALRPAASRRPSSMPGTPTFSKAVHFDSHLEHVRHFLQVDRPLAVSAGTSPADNYDSDTEYPFSPDEKSGSRTPPYEWEIVVNNFPAESQWRKHLPVRLERVWMSPDQKSLLGSIAIANLAFQKSVVCRFTFDYWKTTSEVGAEFNHEIRPKESDCGHDRFQFVIKLSDLANLESKTMYFCIRYNVNGQEYWDNNNDVNFQVDFRKKMLPQNGKKNFQGASAKPINNALPRSGRRSNASNAGRPKSMPIGALDEFGHDSKLFNFQQPLHDFLGESGPTALRLKSSKSTTALPSDNLANRLSTPSGLAFANRYDFGASLTAAMQGNKLPSGLSRDGLYMKPHKRAVFAPSAPAPIQTASLQAPAPAPTPAPATVAAPTKASTSAPAVPSADSPSSAIASASYEEIVNKYCFFNGSKQSSPQIKDGTLRSGRYDGADEFFTHASNSSTNSSTNNSPQMSDKAQHGALRYAIHQNLNPYFQNTHIAIGASPAESPLESLQTPPTMSTSNSSTPTIRSTSPASMAGGLTPLAAIRG